MIKGASFDLTKIDYENTEPYVEFDWLDDDKKSLTLEFTEDTADTTCCLYNGSKLYSSSCKANSRVLTCEFEGKNAGGDPDNPATKFYFNLLCDACSDLSSAASALKQDANDAYVTVAIMAGSYIKYSLALIFSLLVL